MAPASLPTRRVRPRPFWSVAGQRRVTASCRSTRNHVLAIAEAMAGDGLRVLAVASRALDKLPQSKNADAIERDLTFIGLVGLLDPPRPEAKRAVALCRSAGITPIMITGDHLVTARAIASELGLLSAGDTVMTGRELSRLSDEALGDQIRAYSRLRAR